MDVVFLILGAVFVVGVGIALYEWRSGRTLLKHDFGKSAQTEQDRAQMRMEDAHRTSAYRSPEQDI